MSENVNRWVLCRQEVEKWKRELLSAGWKKYKGMLTVWQSPSGTLFYGPHMAWHQMRGTSCPTHKPIAEPAHD